MRQAGWERCCVDPLCDHTYAVVRVSKSKNEVAHVPAFNSSLLSLAKIDNFEWVEGLPEAAKQIDARCDCVSTGGPHGASNGYEKWTELSDRISEETTS